MAKITSVSPTNDMPVIGMRSGSVTGVAPFKDNIPPYGAFANTTYINNGIGAYPIVQNRTLSGRPFTIHGRSSSITWPSSENAYHAQKIIALKESLPPNDPRIRVLDNMLFELATLPKAPGTMFLPKSNNRFDPNTYEGLVNRNLSALGLPDKNAFDRICGSDYHPQFAPNSGINPQTGKPNNYEYMKFALKMKLDQHPELKAMAKEFARRGIMPMEISRHDQTWASFTNGEGKNLLGVAILELGNDYLKNEDRIRGPIQDPHQAYANLQQTHSNRLGYNQLHQFVSNNGYNQPQSQLPHQIAPQSRAVNIAQQSYQSPPPSPMVNQMPPNRVVNQSPPTNPMAYQAPPINRVTNQSPPMNSVVNRPTVLSPTYAVINKTGAKNVSLIDDKNDPSKQIVLLQFNTPQEAEAFARKHGNAPREGATGVVLGDNRAPMVLHNLGLAHVNVRDLKWEISQRDPPLPKINPVQQNHHAPMVNNYNAHSHNNTLNVMKKLVDAVGITLVQDTDPNRPDKCVFKFKFDDPKKAEQFKNSVPGLTNGQGPIPTNDPSTFMLGEDRAAVYFQQILAKMPGSHVSQTMGRGIVDELKKTVGVTQQQHNDPSQQKKLKN